MPFLLIASTGQKRYLSMAVSTANYLAPTLTNSFLLGFGAFEES